MRRGERGVAVETDHRVVSVARGDDVQATQELRMISLIKPDPPGSTERMAEGYRRLGDPAGLVRLRRSAAEREPRSAPAQAELGSALVQSGKLSAAIEAFERALELSDDPKSKRGNKRRR